MSWPEALVRIAECAAVAVGIWAYCKYVLGSF